AYSSCVTRVLLTAVLLLHLDVSAADWPTDYNAALQQARSERKTILVHLHADCSRCNRATDEALREAENHAPIVELYSCLVRVRVDATAVALAAPAPSVVLVDPSGTPVLALQRLEP